LIDWVDSKDDLSLLEALNKSPNDTGVGPLLASGFKGHCDVLQLLQTSLPKDDFATLLRNSANKNGDDIITVTVSSQNAVYLQTLLALMTESGQSAQHLLRKRNSRGLMPLHVAAERGCPAVFKALLDHVDSEGAYFLLAAFDDPLVVGNPSDTSVRGSNVLHTACLCGHPEIVSQILKFLNDAKHSLSDERKQRFLNVRNSKGQTGHWIASRGKGYPNREKCRKLLELQVGASKFVECDVRDDDGVSGEEAGEEGVRTREANEKRKAGKDKTGKDSGK
jgi:ankyrin repeat protein